MGQDQDGPNDVTAGIKKRTAVLVVHGMGSQRALATVRGVVDAVWLRDPDGSGDPATENRVWTHPEHSGVDIDLSVITTSGFKPEQPANAPTRSADFHELYWAHLMSETRAVAVLLWLFELVRKGPRLKPGMKALWWGASIFLCMLLASVVLLAVHAALQFLGGPPLIDGRVVFGTIDTSSVVHLINHPYHEPEALILAPFFVLFMVSAYVALFSLWKRAFWIAIPATAVTVATAWIYFRTGNEELRQFTSLFLPIIISISIAWLIMGRWGATVMTITYVFAGLFFGAYLHSRYMLDWEGCLFRLPRFISPNQCVPYITSLKPFEHVWHEGWIFWSLNERYSAVIALSVIFIYFALYALFLQPYLGDAARYFRNSPGNVAVRREIRKQAVDTLHALHTSGRYDRIVVVAHSLGTVIAYDMLRAYFSRICNDLPRPCMLGSVVDDIDHSCIGARPSPAQAETLRRSSRELVRNIARATATRDARMASWLVTDFVTTGSPLTHAHYLMCNGATHSELAADFERRVGEREFPTCPPNRDPVRNPDDGLLLFENPRTGRKEFHHGALFGLTRWTNLYFPMQELFWGDAIGGPLSSLFGSCVRDVKLHIAASGLRSIKANFFNHTDYWSMTCPGKGYASHLINLRNAVNLKDGEQNKL